MSVNKVPAVYMHYVEISKDSLCVAACLDSAEMVLPVQVCLTPNSLPHNPDF